MPALCSCCLLCRPAAEGCVKGASSSGRLHGDFLVFSFLLRLAVSYNRLLKHMAEIVRESGEITRRIYEVIQQHRDLGWILNAGIEIDALISDREKKSNGRLVLGECVRVKDLYKPYCPYDFLIVIYEKNCIGLDERQFDILLYHELLHIGMNEKKEETVYVINPHDVEEFRTIIDKYGIDWQGR